MKNKFKPITTIHVDRDTEVRYIAKIIREFESDFRFTEINKMAYDLLFRYFTGDRTFETRDYTIMPKGGSLNKGVLIVGTIGSGKSFLLSYIYKTYTKERLQRNSYRVYDYQEIKQDFAQNGMGTFKKFGNIITSPGGLRRNETQTVLIDDFLALGDKISNFSNKINLADVLIQTRYEAYKRSGKLTHFTGNERNT